MILISLTIAELFKNPALANFVSSSTMLYPGLWFVKHFVFSLPSFLVILWDLALLGCSISSKISITGGARLSGNKSGALGPNHDSCAFVRNSWSLIIKGKIIEESNNYNTFQFPYISTLDFHFRKAVFILWGL